MFTQAFIERSDEFERFSVLPSLKTVVTSHFEDSWPLQSMVIVPYSDTNGQFFTLGVADDNRSVILPDSSIFYKEHEFKLSVKGVGAKNPLYGSTPLDYIMNTDFQADSNHLTQLSNFRQITSENWFGESPYGAHGKENAISDLELSDLYFAGEFHGANICPVIEINELPDEYISKRSQIYWYKKYDSSFYQEKRLVPSNIRLFHQSDVTLGQTPDLVLSRFHIESVDQLENFIQNYITSGLTLLTILARTVKTKENNTFIGLDYIDVWLDKDSVLASDGTLFFADIEGLDWIVMSDYEQLKQKILKQINRNYYEFMYCLDLLLKEREKMLSIHLKQSHKRELIANLIDLAILGDSYIKSELSTKSLDLIIDPKHGFNKIAYRFLDLV